MSAIVPVDNPLVNAPQETYRWVVLLHGYNGSHMDCITNTNIVNYAEQNNIIVVMPSGENKFYIDNSITGECYGKFIGEELVNYMRALLPVSKRREDTGIGGISMGGYGAMINGLRYPDTFGHIMTLSAALFLEPLLSEEKEDSVQRRLLFNRLLGDCETLIHTDADCRYLADKLCGNGAAQIPNIYMACGTEDFWYPASVSFREYLRTKGIDTVLEETKADHEWQFWNTYMERALKWFCTNVAL